MRMQTAMKIIIPALVMMLSVTVRAENVKVMKARFDLGDAITKLGILTNSFTDKGMQSPLIAGANAAQEVSTALDKFIVSGLQKNATCERIQEVANNKIAELYNDRDGEFGAAAGKAAGSVKSAMRNYVEVQCINLSE